MTAPPPRPATAAALDPAPTPPAGGPAAPERRALDADAAARGADPAVIGPWLATALADPAWADVAITLVAGGKSNLTFRLTANPGQLVLRRPPTGAILPTAHDMAREWRVLTALAPTDVPVPGVRATCADPAVIGQPFYVMDFLDGPIVRDAFPPGYADEPAQRAAVTDGLLDTLAALHAVDPAAVGLADFGRPEGYMGRQVSRWTRQWQATATADLPALDALAAALAAAVPAAQRHTVVHGDYRLDNCVLDPARVGRVQGVLDWEMSTLGDPLADVGLLLVYWLGPGESSYGVTPQITTLPGFPTRREVAEGYARRTGLDLSALPFYVGFGFFKLAVVVQGIVARLNAGAMGGQTFGDLDALVPALVERGHATLRDGI